MAPKEKSTKPKMANKTKLYLLVLLVGIGLTAWSLVGKNNNDSISEQKGNDQEIAQEEDSNGNYIAGILENSDDVNKGNLKLVSEAGHIYIRTSRDFNAFIGSQVLMLIEGTTDNFTLVNIEKRIEKDGYIQNQ